jgi:hypothetical protein
LLHEIIEDGSAAEGNHDDRETCGNETRMISSCLLMAGA